MAAGLAAAVVFLAAGLVVVFLAAGLAAAVVFLAAGFAVVVVFLVVVVLVAMAVPSIGVVVGRYYGSSTSDAAGAVPLAMFSATKAE